MGGARSGGGGRWGRLGRGLLGLCVALLVTGCASLPAWDPPEVTLADLRIEDFTAFETSATILVRLANTNRDPMIVEGATYNLYVDGFKVGLALSNEVVEIEPLSSAVQRAELRLSNLALATRIQSVFQSRRFDYRIRGKVFVPTGVRTRRVRVESSGSFDFEQAAGRLESTDPVGR